MVLADHECIQVSSSMELQRSDCVIKKLDIMTISVVLEEECDFMNTTMAFNPAYIPERGRRCAIRQRRIGCISAGTSSPWDCRRATRRWCWASGRVDVYAPTIYSYRVSTYHWSSALLSVYGAVEITVKVVVAVTVKVAVKIGQ